MASIHCWKSRKTTSEKVCAQNLIRGKDRQSCRYHSNSFYKSLFHPFDFCGTNPGFVKLIFRLWAMSEWYLIGNILQNFLWIFLSVCAQCKTRMACGGGSWNLVKGLKYQNTITSWVYLWSPKTTNAFLQVRGWIMPWLPCWLPKGQQVSHQRWIRGFCCAQVMKHASERIHPGFETQGRCHQNSKIGVSVTPQKGLVSSKTSL